MIAYPSPAKLNLFLHVVGQREDGYHLLQTAFQLINYGDILYLEVRYDGQIVHENPLPGLPAPNDLTVRAARLLQQVSGSKLGLSIRIDKHLPMGGGLGGGSSNAATILLALNRLWGLHYSRTKLQEIGLSLGADVPFFIFGKNAWAEGIGEVLSPLHLPSQYFIVLVPKAQVSTADIFSAADLTKNTKSIRMRDFAMAFTRNDLERVACRKYPEIAGCVTWLNQFSQARMTGSGSCVFAEFLTEEAANKVLAQLPAGLTGFVAKGIHQHPLFEFASDVNR